MRQLYYLHLYLALVLFLLENLNYALVDCDSICPKEQTLIENRLENLNYALVDCDFNISIELSSIPSFLSMLENLNYALVDCDLSVS